jgi:hypothetical protein
MKASISTEVGAFVMPRKEVNILNVLSDGYVKLVVYDQETGKEIAVVTNELITTAADNIVVKLTPSNKEM